MQTSAKGRKFIAAWEGNVLEVYKDPVGIPTGGVGHVLSKDELLEMPVGTKITAAQSDLWLISDLKIAENAVNGFVKVPLNQSQFDALVSLAFNIGIGNLKRSSLLKSINSGDFDGDGFLSWTKAKGKILPGLVKRRKAERQLFLTPSAVVPDSKPQPAPPVQEQPIISSTPPVEQPPIPKKPFDWSSIYRVFVRISDGASDTLDRITAFQGKVSSSRFSVAIVRALAVLFALFAHYWPYIIAAVVLVIVCEWFMRRTDK